MQTLQNGIVIDLQKLKAISYDAGREEVTAGGGVLSGEFQEFVHSVKRETSALYPFIFEFSIPCEKIAHFQFFFRCRLVSHNRTDGCGHWRGDRSSSG